MTTFYELARYDWVIPFKGRKLHAIGRVTGDMAGDYEDWDETVPVKLACGRTAKVMIPGMFTRMLAPRCKQCCIKVRYPQGIGSPKNDNECRKILGLPARSELEGTR